MDVQPPDKRTIFECALEFACGAEREAYLEDACAAKAEMRAQVDSLLKAHNDVGSFLDGPAFDAQRTAPMEPISERPGSAIGPYKLLEQIGEGGFGVVFMAEQEHPIRRRVAIKVIKPGMDTRQVIARFEAERQALALMDHPNIAHVLDAGATDSGRPYFVMELVRGIPITNFCDQNRLSIDERLKLFTIVCQAVQHAHQKGIIHRDIKPTNVLVTLHDGVPVPRVIDFGVAKATGQRLTDKTLFTAFAQMIGTPLYMSPEQAEMSGLDVDTRSDIYSLGVMLYELLTGTTPFSKERLQEAAYDEIRRIIREEEPPKPSTRISTLGPTTTAISTQRKSDAGKLSSLVRGELDWIVMKCLDKDRNRRYDTPSGLARDIEHYLQDDPVEACPPSAAYRLRKFARRNRRALATGTIVFAALLAGTFVSTWQAIRATRATHAEREVRQHLDLALTAAKESEAAAKQSERVAVENANKAQRQRDRANIYFMGARSVVDDMSGRLNNSRLLQIPEITNIRKQLFEDLLGFYQEMVQYEAVDPSAAQDKAGALRMVGDIQHMLGNPVLAEKAYREAIALREPYVAQHPHYFESYQVLATCHANLGDLMVEMRRPDEAETAYRRAIVLWSQLATERMYDHGVYLESLRMYHKKLFNLLEHRGQSEAARAICGQLLAPFEESAAKSRQDVDLQLRLADALYWGGRMLEDTGRAEEGHKLCDRAVVLYAKLPATVPPGPQREKLVFRYLIKTSMLAKRKRWPEVEVTSRKILELAPDSYSVLNNVAWVLARDSDATFSDRNLCVTFAEKAVELDSKQDALGAALYRRGDWKAAIVAIERSMELSQGGDSRNWFFLAMSKWQLGEKDAAHEWYDKAVAWMQSNAASNAELIRFHSEAAELLGVKDPQTQPASSRPAPATRPAEGGERDTAQSQPGATNLVRLTVHNADGRASVLNSQAWTLATDSDPAKRDPRRAIKLAQEALELAPTVADYWNTLGVAEYRAGNWKDAISSLQKYRELRTKDAEWGNPFFLAMAHRQLGNSEEARSWYDKGVGWMDKHASTSETLIRFRREAADLLGANEKK